MKRIIAPIALSLLALSTTPAVANDYYYVDDSHVYRGPLGTTQTITSTRRVTLNPWTSTYYQNFKEKKITFKTDHDCKLALNHAVDTIGGKLLSDTFGSKIDNNIETRITCKYEFFFFRTAEILPIEDVLAKEARKKEENEALIKSQVNELLNK